MNYSSSMRYGAGLNEARRATLILGLAEAPMCLNALRAKRAFALSKEAGARIMPDAVGIFSSSSSSFR